MKKDDRDAIDLEQEYNSQEVEEELLAVAPSPLLKVVAFLTALVFIGFTFLTLWPGQQIPLELVKESLRLAKQIDVQRLQSAVVEINVIAGDPAFPIKASARKGTGFNISNDGLIVTNYHVIKDALNMTITFPNGAIYKAEKWTTKPDFDLALIKISGSKLPFVPLNTKRFPVQGDKIRVVGNPLSLNNVVVEGKVNGYMLANGIKVFSIDAPIYPGNSGSPVFDQDGLVTGIVFANYQDKSQDQKTPFGLAIPISNILDMKFK